MQAITTYFGDVLSCIRTVQFDYHGQNALSSIRHISSIAGTGAIAFSGSEISLTTGSTAASAVHLETTELVRFGVGYVTEVAIAIRAPASPLTGGEISKWGAYDATNGAGFGIDSTGLFAFTRVAGTDTTIPIASWNVDKLNGAGPSLITLDITKGVVFVIRLTRFGEVEFSVAADNSNHLVTALVHKLLTTTNPIFTSFSLPISADVINGVTSANNTLAVGGARCASYGDNQPSGRITTQNTTLPGGLTVGAYTLLHSVRRKSGYAMTTIPDYWIGIDYTPSIGYPFYWHLVQNGTLTTASYGAVNTVDTGETSLEADIAAVTLVGGTLIATGMCAADGTNYRHPHPIAMAKNYGYSLLVSPFSSAMPTGNVASVWREFW